ncbi:hypothetical protein [Sulfurospirillum barnesii]|uniref:Uncharacterized protein n=1 Tax=Sulfurospirillum barnesii (strain ATCC 700032 / DSM 10660 / SES-3) TaxID=760154 RepID=I3XU64_SULBS|nr:hypothetical protein [Sulfurospirillum barnesii]AFL67488.1 hypothetical protein Sulba_0161 [Sulfurospirillum barnesii SES-3]
MEKKQFIHALNQTSKETFAFTCNDFDVIVCIGTFPSRHDKALLECLSTSDAAVVYLFSMEDKALVEKATFFSRYEVGSEEGVLALLAKSFLLHVKIPAALEAYFEALDEGYLSAESNVGEEEIEEIDALYQGASRVLLVLGDDVMRHARSSNIAHLAGLIATYGKAKLYVVGAQPEDIVLVEDKGALEEIADIKSFDGVVVYECPLNDENEEAWLIGSTQFQMAAKVKEDENIRILFNEEAHSRTFVHDERLKGVIALMPCAKANGEYPYRVVKIVK